MATFQLPDNGEFPEDGGWAVGDKARVRPDFVQEFCKYHDWMEDDKYREFTVAAVHRIGDNSPPYIELKREDKTRLGYPGGLLAYKCYRVRPVAPKSEGEVNVARSEGEVDVARFRNMG